MSGFTAVNSNGSYFKENPNPLLVLCLDADPIITARGRRAHKKTVLLHVFERGATAAKTTGPRVPTWAQVNAALDEIEKVGWAATCSRWGRRGLLHTWNPHANPGSQEARLPWNSSSQPSECGDC